MPSSSYSAEATRLQARDEVVERRGKAGADDIPQFEIVPRRDRPMNPTGARFGDGAEPIPLQELSLRGAIAYAPPFLSTDLSGSSAGAPGL